MAKIIVEEVTSTEHIENHKCLRRTPHLYVLYNYCPVCGESLEREVKTVLKKCSECGWPIILAGFEVNYCPNCGCKFEQ